MIGGEPEYMHEKQPCATCTNVRVCRWVDGVWRCVECMNLQVLRAAEREGCRLVEEMKR